MSEPTLCVPAASCGRNDSVHPDFQDKPAQVAILLCTYQGERFLSEQIDSFLSQTYGSWKVWASDDGSTDGTLGILDAYREKLGHERLAVVHGPGRGFVANFLSLVCRNDIQADFYAYADQDDIWLNNKLERAIKWLTSLPRAVPALYCSRTLFVDEENREIGMSALFSKPPAFSNALVQSIGGGNTMVFNAAARALLCQAGADVPAVSHDWWTYMVVAGCGGEVFYDAAPSLRYRQHGDNLVGMNTGIGARFERWRLLWDGRFRRWNEANLIALRRLRERLTPENRKIMDRFSHARTLPRLPGLVALWHSGVHRQSWVDSLGLFVAFFFKKM